MQAGDACECRQCSSSRRGDQSLSVVRTPYLSKPTISANNTRKKLRPRVVPLKGPRLTDLGRLLATAAVTSPTPCVRCRIGDGSREACRTHHPERLLNRFEHRFARSKLGDCSWSIWTVSRELQQDPAHHAGPGRVILIAPCASERSCPERFPDNEHRYRLLFSERRRERVGNRNGSWMSGLLGSRNSGAWIAPERRQVAAWWM